MQRSFKSKVDAWVVVLLIIPAVIIFVVNAGALGGGSHLSAVGIALFAIPLQYVGAGLPLWALPRYGLHCRACEPRGALWTGETSWWRLARITRRCDGRRAALSLRQRSRSTGWSSSMAWDNKWWSHRRTKRDFWRHYPGGASRSQRVPVLSSFRRLPCSERLDAARTTS